jgi:copper homeostasis protein (lipoprotein)
MSRQRPWVWLLVFWLAGCGRDSAPVAPVLPSDGRIEWQGLLACADCDGIRTQLVLLRSGDRRSYTLTETYLADDGDARFSETGDWERDRGLLRLRGETGATRFYLLLSDGRLQPRDARGQPFRQEGDFLVPVTAANAP